MIHLGDITKIDGAKAPAVEVIIGGSPCQDLSIVGKRAGLAGERSGLFMEQIRIIKEMRRESERSGANVIIPRFMVWENVPGAFNSNGGEDFRTVLEETARIVDCRAVIPRPPCGWTNSGAVMGDGWSIAWRVHDAQFWGVPQRRRRIALVADFGGYTAPEILFERNGLSRNTPPSSTPWKDFAAAIAERFGGSNCSRRSLKNDVVIYDGSQITSRTCRSNPKTGDPCHTLHAFGAGQSYCVTAGTEINERAILSYGFPLGFRPENTQEYIEKATTICNGTRPGFCNGVIALDRAAFNQDKNAKYDFAVECDGVNPTLTAKGPSAVYDARGNGQGDIAPTITGDHQSRVTDYTALCIGNGQANQLKISEKVGALNCMHDQQALLVAGFKSGVGAKTHGIGYEEDKLPTLSAASFDESIAYNNIVRRLTPLECERLQGYPDGWTDIGDWIDSKGKMHKTADTPRYKALGNSIALPFWAWMLRKLAAFCKEKTMASLFDGIGGLPLIWETLNGKGSCLWASEIEEFPIAVTKYHFGG